MARKKAEHTPEPRVRTFETFRSIGDYEISGLKQDHPSSFNGDVRVKRYRVTIEEVDEPDDVIMQRIQKLWDECENHHHWGPLRAVAKRYGMELVFNHHK